MAVKKSAAKGTARRAGRAAAAAGSNPYVRRLIEDEQLRNNMREAFEAARHAYKRMANGKRPARTLVEDRKLQRDLRQAASSLREAAEQLRGKRRRRKHRGRRLFLLLIGIGLVLAFSEGARKTVLDRLFGAEEEFEYTSTTSPEEQPAAA
jgi:hypothetical protein